MTIFATSVAAALVWLALLRYRAEAWQPQLAPIPRPVRKPSKFDVQ